MSNNDFYTDLEQVKQVDGVYPLARDQIRMYDDEVHDCCSKYTVDDNLILESIPF